MAKKRRGKELPLLRPVKGMIIVPVRVKKEFNFTYRKRKSIPCKKMKKTRLRLRGGRRQVNS